MARMALTLRARTGLIDVLVTAMWRVEMKGYLPPVVRFSCLSLETRGRIENETLWKRLTKLHQRLLAKRSLD